MKTWLALGLWLIATSSAIAQGSGPERLAIDDSRFLRAMMLLDGGDPAAAVQPLQSLVAERAGALYVLEEHFSGEHERRDRLRSELGLLHRKLAIAEHRQKDEAAALRHLDRLLEIEPDATLDPLEAPRALMLKLDELRDTRDDAQTREQIELPLGSRDGIEHSPPLLVVRGTEAALYARIDDGSEGRVMLYHCVVPRASDARVAGGCKDSRRLPMEALRGHLFAVTLPAALTIEAKEIRYRIGFTDSRARRHSTPWFVLAVASDVNQHAAAFRDRYGPRAEARIRASRVVERLAPAAPWPDGVREIDSRGSALHRYREPY